jgi:hypothetical protein
MKGEKQTFPTKRSQVVLENINAKQKLIKLSVQNVGLARISPECLQDIESFEGFMPKPASKSWRRRQMFCGIFEFRTVVEVLQWSENHGSGESARRLFGIPNEPDLSAAELCSKIQ